MNKLTDELFEQFLLSDRLFITPDDIGLYFSDDPDILRDQLQFCKNVASDIRKRLGGLNREQRVRIFRSKMISSGVFDCFNDFNGSSPEDLVDVRDVSITIDYRNFERRLKIPHTTYRTSFSNSNSTYLKVMPNFRYDECFIEFADSIGIHNHYPCCYYPRDSITYWLLLGEVPNATPLEQLSPSELSLYRNSIIKGIGEQLALIHILSAGDFDFLVSDGRVVSIDHEFLFNENDYSETDSRKGKSVSHMLRRLPGSLSDNLKAFINAYIRVWERVDIEKNELKKTLLISENPRAVYIVERSLERGPLPYLDTELYYLLDWRKIELYSQLWRRRSSPIPPTSNLDDLERRAHFVLTSPLYPDDRRMWELSLDGNLLDAGYRLIENVLSTQDLQELRVGLRCLDNENSGLFNSLKKIYH